MQTQIASFQLSRNPSISKLNIGNFKQHPLDTLRDDLREQIDMVDLCTCSRELLDELMNEVSTVEARAFLLGIYEYRVTLSDVTGQRF